jgi:Domain of unknown function (DUF4224)
MTTPELYDPTETTRLTGAARAATQAAWLKQNGIPHRVDGKRVIVSREHVRAWLEGRTVQQSTGPNWGALKRA